MVINNIIVSFYLFHFERLAFTLTYLYISFFCFLGCAEAPSQLSVLTLMSTGGFSNWLFSSITFTLNRPVFMIWWFQVYFSCFMICFLLCCLSSVWKSASSQFTHSLGFAESKVTWCVCVCSATHSAVLRKKRLKWEEIQM